MANNSYSKLHFSCHPPVQLSPIRSLKYRSELVKNAFRICHFLGFDELSLETLRPWSLRCTGCRACETACPYAAIRFVPDDEAKAGKCDFCVDRIDSLEPPICVAACPMRALDFGAIDMLAQESGFVTQDGFLPDIEETTPSLLIKPK